MNKSQQIAKVKSSAFPHLELKTIQKSFEFCVGFMLICKVPEVLCNEQNVR